jgi:hypothetical protein
MYDGLALSLRTETARMSLTLQLLPSWYPQLLPLPSLAVAVGL